MKIRLFVRIAICTMFVLALCTAAFAADALTVSVGEDTSYAGGTVNIPISVDGNSDGFGGMEFSVSFDSTCLTLTEIDTADALAEFTITPVDLANTAGRVDFAFVNLTPENITGDGDVATLTFEIKEGTAAMETPLLLYVPAGVAFRYENNSMADVDVTAVNGAVTVSKTPWELLSDLGIRLPDCDLDSSAAITRLQLALMLAQITSGDVGLEVWDKDSASEIYADVTEYGKAVDYLRNNGFMYGKTEGAFSVDDSIKYQDLLSVAVRLLRYGTEDMTYPYGYILAADRLGITDGISAEYASSITVKDACRLVWNMFNTMVSVKDPLTEQIVYPDSESLWETTTGNTIERSTFSELYFYKTHNCTFGDWVVGTPATPAAGGTEKHVCMVCGKEEIRFTPKLDIPDVNGDGMVTVIDIMRAVDAAVNKTYLPAADLNGDGKITLLDLVKIVALVN